MINLPHHSMCECTTCQPIIAQAAPQVKEYAVCWGILYHAEQIVYINKQWRVAYSYNTNSGLRCTSTVSVETWDDQEPYTPDQEV